jgi:hypothetical protein
VSLRRPELAGALTDNDPSTRWYGAIHGESATDTIALTFPAPSIRTSSKSIRAAGRRATA